MKTGLIRCGLIVLTVLGAQLALPQAAQAATETRLSADASFQKPVAPEQCPGLTSADTKKFNVMDGIAYGGGHVYIVWAVPSSDKLYEKTKGTLLTEWTISGDDISCNRAKKNLNLGHGNDATYVPSYGKYGAVLLVPRGTKTTPKSTISIVRVSDLSLKGTTSFPKVTPSGICYNAESNKYKYVVRSGDSLIGFRETETHTVGSRITASKFTFEAPKETTGKQGLDCVGTGFYNVLSISPGTHKVRNYVYQYPWNAKSSKSWTRKLVYYSADDLAKKHPAAEEVEGMFHIGNTYYLGINHNGAPDVIARLTPWTTP